MLHPFLLRSPKVLPIDVAVHSVEEELRSIPWLQWLQLQVVCLQPTERGLQVDPAAQEQAEPLGALEHLREKGTHRGAVCKVLDAIDHKEHAVAVALEMAEGAHETLPWANSSKAQALVPEDLDEGNDCAGDLRQEHGTPALLGVRGGPLQGQAYRQRRLLLRSRHRQGRGHQVHWSPDCCTRKEATGAEAKPCELRQQRGLAQARPAPHIDNTRARLPATCQVPGEFDHLRRAAEEVLAPWGQAVARIVEAADGGHELHRPSGAAALQRAAVLQRSAACSGELAQRRKALR
mmetsp:Transcript_46274/g.147758  ORF Transcript_46274/g.147758 Transcript_46274/m.147758 type:complete len:292 (-) Transcript_46274:1311-2186(-)